MVYDPNTGQEVPDYLVDPSTDTMFGSDISGADPWSWMNGTASGGTLDNQGFMGGDLASLILGGSSNLGAPLPTYRKTSPMSNSQAFSFVDKLTRPVKPQQTLNYDKLLQQHMDDYKRSLSDADTQNTYGLDMYGDPRTAGVVQGYLNDLQSGTITPEAAMKNFLYRTGQTDKQGNPRDPAGPVTSQSLTIDMVNKANDKLNGLRANAWDGRNEVSASRASWDWLDKNFRGFDPAFDKFLDENRPGVLDEKTGLYSNNTKTGMNDKFAREARRRVGALVSNTSDAVGAKIAKYGKDPTLDQPAYREAMNQLRGLDPNLDKFFTANPDAARVVTNPQLIDSYKKMIADLTTPQAAARRRGLPAPDAPGDLAWFTDKNRAAMQEMFNTASRAKAQASRAPTQREQVQSLINMLLVQRMFPNPKG